MQHTWKRINIFIGKHEGKNLLGRPRNTHGEISKWIWKGTRWEVWI
jgi:hypothetical protein